MKKFLLLFLVGMIGFSQSHAQNSRWMIGSSAGVALSKTSNNDTLANNFSTRNRLGGFGNIHLNYDLNPASSLNLSVGYLNAGYKINNDTMAYNTSINKGISYLSTGLGLTFRQGFGSSNFISERFGMLVNTQLSSSSTDTFNNQENATRFRIVQEQNVAIYPLFYLGVAFGGNTEGGNRYEFSVTYQQSFSTSQNLNVEYGEFLGERFPLNYRSGNLQVGFTYYFNFGNFQKSEEYFYD